MPNDPQLLAYVGLRKDANAAYRDAVNLAIYMKPGSPISFGERQKKRVRHAIRRFDLIGFSLAAPAERTRRLEWLESEIRRVR